MLNVSLIGFGYWGPNIAKNLVQIPNIKFHTIIDSNEKSLNKAKQLFPYINTSTSLTKKILEQNDAFIVATPIHTHYDIAKELLNYNKHVLIQKPMAHSSSVCDELNQIAEKNSLKLMIAHTFLFSPAIRKIKKDIDNNLYGNLNYISSCRINLGLFQRHHDVIWDLAPHDFSILRYLYDKKPLFISAVGKYHTKSLLVDTANITVGYDDGFMSTIQINWLTPFKFRNIIVCGDKKTVMYDDCAVEKVKVYDAGIEINDDVFSYRKGDINIPKLEDKESIYYECYEFISSIVQNTQPISNGKFGYEIVKMIEKTQESILLNGSPVYL